MNRGKTIKRVLILFLLVQLFYLPLAFAQSPKRVAILAFKNLSGDTSLDYIGSGFGETLTTKLANVKELELYERMQILKLLEEQKLQISGYVEPDKAVEVGKMLGVQFTVIGSFMKVGENLKADTRLVNVETGKIDAASDVKGKYGNIFELMEELALKLAQNLNAPVTPEEKTQIARKPAQNVSAYEWFAKGVAYYEKSLTSRYDAEECFQKAIQLDKDFAEAYIYLGGIYTWQFIFNKDAASKEKALTFLTKGLELKPKHALAFYYRALVRRESFDDSMADFDKAIRLSPGNHEFYAQKGFVCLQNKEYQCAIEALSKAIEFSSPQAKYIVSCYHYRGNAYAAMGQFDKAIEDYSKTIAISLAPDYNLYIDRAGAYCKKGLLDLANEDYKKAESISYGFYKGGQCP